MVIQKEQKLGKRAGDHVHTGKQTHTHSQTQMDKQMDKQMGKLADSATKYKHHKHTHFIFEK